MQLLITLAVGFIAGWLFHCFWVAEVKLDADYYKAREYLRKMRKGE